MPAFSFEALDAQGQTRKGMLEADTAKAARSQLRAQASRAADWNEHGLSQRLRQRADLLEARLVDPLWRAFAARALQVAA